MSCVKNLFKKSDILMGKCCETNNCFGCCNAFKPRYKRLVDNIFPVFPQEGLVKHNMEKLTFYSLSLPEKLDRIGEYLYEIAARDIYRRRFGFALLSMGAMDHLLLACHSQSLNLFVISYLKMVQKLLETQDSQLQIVATQSFVRFANIEEDTPSYHRRYDFFISKFSSMCHNDDNDLDVRNKIRVAGIKGLQAVIRKTISDNLVENIWDATHMNKILPSLLFNMQQKFNTESITDTVDSKISNNDDIEEETDPHTLAETCLRELVGKASFGHITSFLEPVLQHFEYHELWVPNNFATSVFKNIMFSIQSHYSYAVIENLMTHLDKPSIKLGVADILSKIIAIAAEECVGPSVLEIVNSLLNHLRTSVMQSNTSENDERRYQEALINALGEFTNHLPDYQKIEIMMFIMNKITNPVNSQQKGAEVMLQNILLKSLLKVGTKYKSIHLSNAFPLSFLEPLLQMSLASDANMRLLVHQILHTLIDRHGNLNKLSKPLINYDKINLKVEEASRPDVIFLKKNGAIIFDTFSKSLQIDSNTVNNVEAIFTTFALLSVEVYNFDVAMELLQLSLDLQNVSLNGKNLNQTQCFHLNAIVVSLVLLTAEINRMDNLVNYTKNIIEKRNNEAKYLLPDLQDEYSNNCIPINKLQHLLFDALIISESVKESGFDVSNFHRNISSFSNSNTAGVIPLTHRQSWLDSSTSLSDTDNQSDSSSPGMQRKTLADNLNFESMKRVLSESTEKQNEIDERRRNLNEIFKSKPLSELVQFTQSKQSDLQTQLTDILQSLDIDKEMLVVKSNENEVPLYEQFFPELFNH